jgi:hypothetical protein
MSVSSLNAKPSLRDRGRAAIVAAVVAFGATQAGFSLAMDHWLPVLHDPEYGYKLARLRQRQAEHPDCALVAVLGSSRSGMGLRPESFPNCTLPDGHSCLVFNFAITGCGPVQELQTLQRLLRHGVRPDRLLIEVHPLLMHQENGVGEENWLEVRRMGWRDLAVVGEYLGNYRSLVWRWLKARLVACHSNRFLIMNYLARSWVNLDRQDPWTGLSDYGWLPYGRQEVTAEEYRRGQDNAWKEYSPMLANYRITERADRALRAVLALCRQRGIEAALFVMPEAASFREWYGVESRRRFNEYLAGVERECAVPVYDATEWCDDRDFWDSHHLLASGAKRFSERFGREALVRFVSRPSDRAVDTVRR